MSKGCNKVSVLGKSGNFEEGGDFFDKEIKGIIFKHFVLVTEKDAGNHPVINLKELNKPTPYSLPVEKHAPARGLNVQDRLQDTYFAVPLVKNSQKYMRFQWKRNL